MKRSKYNNRKTEYQGVLYDSKLEAKIAMELEALRRCKQLTDIKRQVTVDLRGMNGGLICRHRVDFLVTHKDGRREFIEAKGMKTAVWLLKHKLFEDNFPNDTYTVRTK